MSPALRVALSMAVICEAKNPALLFQQRAIDLDRYVLRQQARRNRLLIGFEVVGRSTQSVGFACVLGDRRRDQLCLCHHLGNHRVEPIVDQCANIDLARHHHRRDALADLLRIGKLEPPLTDEVDVPDEPACQIAAEIVPPLAADRQDLHRLALRFQTHRQGAGRAADIGVERARQTPIPGDRNQQMGLVLSRSRQQCRRVRAIRKTAPLGR